MASAREGTPSQRQFHIVIQAAADHVQVGIVQAGNDGLFPGVDHLGIRPLVLGNVLVGPHGQYLSILDGDGAGHRSAFIQRCYVAV